MPIYVRDLLDPDTKQWNEAAVALLFNEEEAKIICGLSVSRWGCPDKLIWHFTKHGGFTVKSAYEVAQFLQRNGELGRQGQGESSVRNRHRPLWGSIWKLQVPPKIRNFIWRACLNALAVRQNLRKRHVDIEDVCSLCDGEGESQVHLFFQCEFARMFWFSSPLQLDTHLVTGGDFLSCWHFLLNKYEKEENLQDILQWVAFGLWRVWKARNTAVFEGHHPQPHDISLVCQKQIEEFVAARQPSIPLIQDQPRPPDWDCGAFQAWQKPADGWLKFNCDGAWTQAHMRGGAGWVARDSNGWMEMAGGVGGFSCQSALAAEAEAVREAVAAGLEARVPKMLVETDCKQLVAMLHGDLKTESGIDGPLFAAGQLSKGLQAKIIARCEGTIELNKDFEDIIAVDACFIIELFLMNFCEPENHENDYILRSPWLRKAVEQDLILFENQLPYSLLQELYQDFAVPASPNFQPCKEVQEQANRHSNTNHYLQYCSPCCRHCFPRCWWIPSKDQSIVQVEPANDDPLLKLTCEFFKDYSKGKSVKNGVRPKHFTDLVRDFLCPDKEMDFEHSITPIKNIYAARKLRASGVKFRPLKEGHFIIEKDDATKCKFNLACFRNMDLKLTQFCVKDETECVVRNIMALEQFLYPDKPYICNYFLLMDQLVDTVDDVDLLVENRVILNMLGSNKAVAKLVNRLCEQIMDDKSCYFDICEQLNKHYENFWNRNVATLKRVYFKDLWTGSSTVLGVVVLVFSVIGTIKSLKL